jgi:hypothetical protein
MGTRRTPHPAIPEPTPENLVDVVKAIKESLEIGRTDRRGDPLDNWVTNRDLVEGGIADLTDENDSTNKAGGVGPMTNPPGSIVGPPPFGGPFLTPRDPTLIRPLPGRPTNVRAMAVWDGIMVKWDWPPDDGNIDWLGAIIWVSSTPVFAQGNLGGYSSTNFWLHEGVGLQGPEGGSDEYTPGVRYYWVAWFGRSHDDSPTNEWTPVTGISNQSEWTPYNYQPGVRGETAIDPEYVLNILTGQVTESQIYDSLNTRINLIDYDLGGNQYFEPVQDRILAATEGVQDGVYAAIAQYAGVDITEDEIRGEYNVRLDLNGYVVGFGLSALAQIDQVNVNYGATSAFVIKADTFAVVFPGVAAQTPFVVGRVNNIPTVGIDGQLVVDGTLTANAIQAYSIGANQINAGSVWAGIVNADRIFGSTFATGPSPQTRVEINGQGTDNEQYPLWFGWGQTSGVSVENISEPYFFVDSYGTVKLAGELFVTGTGRFWLGSNESGNYRLELGGYNDNILMWAGRTEWPNRSIDPGTDDWIFYIDKDGDAKFRGTVEAEYVSGEFTQVVPINGYSGVEVSTPSGEIPVWPNEYTLIQEWVLPASPFNNPDVDLQPGHVPWLQLQVELTGIGQTAGTLRIEWDSGNGIWQMLSDSVYNIGTYGGLHQIFAAAPSRIYSASRMRLWAAGRANEHPTVGKYAGLLMGIR